LEREEQESFELLTNQAFNNQYELDFHLSGANKVRPIILDRLARKEVASKEMLNRTVNENKIRNFSFRERFRNNVKRGRLSSVVGHESLSHRT
jgi:hypothetical protein